MTIRFTTAWERYPVDAIVTLSAPEEARLIALGFATADLDLEQQYVQGVNAITDEDGNVLSLVTKDGKPVNVGGGLDLSSATALTLPIQPTDTILASRDGLTLNEVAFSDLQNQILVQVGNGFTYSVKNIDWYVSATGADNTTGGNKNFATVDYALTQANASTGDKILYIDAGNYTTARITPNRTRLSIMGAGRDVVSIRVTQNSGGNQTRAGMYFGGDSEGVDGNQFITGFTLDGGDLSNVPFCAFGMYIRGRSNVRAYGLKFKNFATWGLTFSGQATEIDGFGPAILATGNKAFDIDFENCAAYYGIANLPSSSGYGNFQFGGQDGLEYFDLRINQTQRGSGLNGFGIKMYRNGYNRNCVGHHNTIVRDPTGCYYKFDEEQWMISNWELHHNNYSGAVDMIANKGDVMGIGRAGANPNPRFGLYAHHNNFVSTIEALDGNSMAFNIEDQAANPIYNTPANTSSDIILECNKTSGIKYFARIFSTASASDPHVWNNIKIVSNLGKVGSIFANHGLSQYDTINNLTIDYNTGDGTGAPVNKCVDGIQLTTAVYTNVKVRRNILFGYVRNPITTGDGVNSSITGYVEDANIIFNCGSASSPNNKRTHIAAAGATAPTGVSGTNINIPATTDNLFTNYAAGDYTLKSGSPAVSVASSVIAGEYYDILDRLRGSRSGQSGFDDCGAYGYFGANFNQPTYTINRSDDFNRANGEIGTPSGGGAAWTVLSGTWTISSNQATSSSFLSAVVLDSGSPNVLVKVTRKGTASGVLVFRAIDNDNYMYVDIGTTQVNLYKRVAGVRTTLLTISNSLVGDEVLEVIADANNLISARKNGVVMFSFTDSTHATATRHGLWATNSGGTYIYDDFSISNIT